MLLDSYISWLGMCGVREEGVGSEGGGSEGGGCR